VSSKAGPVPPSAAASAPPSDVGGSQRQTGETVSENRSPIRVALLGNPNTGKTTIFNRLCGLRHKTANFPGTTQEARVGAVGSGDTALEIIDLPGVYSLELEQSESEICRAVLAGDLAPRGEPIAPPDAICVVTDATNLLRGLVMAGESLRRRLPTVVAVNMIDLAHRHGTLINEGALEAALGCRVVLCSARTGEGLERLRSALSGAQIATHTPPGGEDPEGIERWAEDAFAAAASAPALSRQVTLTDRLDRAFTHPVLGALTFILVMGGLFFALFWLAQFPMEWIEALFVHAGAIVGRFLPDGAVQDLVAQGVVGGISGVVVFLPQICLLFFLISLLEDTGYLARAAFVMDRVLRPFGLPGHAFVPLLSSHACALPGLMATRAIPDRRQRLATILVAPFTTCSARLPVYVLMTSLLFPRSPALAALTFVSAYALGLAAAVLSALLARRTILRGPARPMALELPTYKWPSLSTAFVTTYDRALVFLRQAGTNILAICIILWWLSSYPRSEPPAEALALRRQAAVIATTDPAGSESLRELAGRRESAHASAHTFAGRIGRFVQPAFAPIGFDWQLSIGVMTSFAAREVFVSTMAIVLVGEEDPGEEGVIERIRTARRNDAKTPLFTAATCWSLLIYYVLAMQCLPTLAVTARESGSVKWALLQLLWMQVVAYVAALVVYQSLLAAGVT